MSFILLPADWPNSSFQAAIKVGLMIFSPTEYGFLHLAICSDIKYVVVRSEVLLVEILEIMFYVSAYFLHIKIH